MVLGLAYLTKQKLPLAKVSKYLNIFSVLKDFNSQIPNNKICFVIQLQPESSYNVVCEARHAKPNGCL